MIHKLLKFVYLNPSSNKKEISSIVLNIFSSQEQEKNKQNQDEGSHKIFDALNNIKLDKLSSNLT
jgi:hypothetical protein